MRSIRISQDSSAGRPTPAGQETARPMATATMIPRMAAIASRSHAASGPACPGRRSPRMLSSPERHNPVRAACQQTAAAASQAGLPGRGPPTARQRDSPCRNCRCGKSPRAAIPHRRHSPGGTFTRPSIGLLAASRPASLGLTIVKFWRGGRPHCQARASPADSAHFAGTAGGGGLPESDWHAG